VNADDGLAGWVDDFVAQHEAWRQIRPCWPKHPSLIVELSVLADMHTSLVDSGTKAGPADWGAYLDYVARAIARMAASPAATACSDDEHTDPMTWDVDAWLARRPGG
jgi:hypothetical protein